MGNGVKYVYDEAKHRMVAVFDNAHHQRMSAIGDAIAVYMKTFGKKEYAYRHCVDWTGLWYVNDDSKPPEKK